MAELREPGPFLALSNNDPESNNVLVHAAGEPDARLIDFEFAGYTHCLHDAVCLHVPGPGWLSVADPGPADAYRRALATGVPEAEDDRRHGFGLAAAGTRTGSSAGCRRTRRAAGDPLTSGPR
ncbi:hypothetical protein ACGFI3_16560 [Nonomuraea wenchangensis]|uniref:hypothetical protein n=1 Tax=Nonomuraea wenchangensis TaxID=568860 RepID=UPI003715C44F